MDIDHSVDRLSSFCSDLFYKSESTSHSAVYGRQSFIRPEPERLELLRRWLDAPEQTTLRGDLRTLGQLGWDTPSTAGIRLICSVLWQRVLPHFGVRPAWAHHDALTASPLLLTVHDVYAERSNIAGWEVSVRFTDPQSLTSDGYPIAWFLNALLNYDVELGLASAPLFRRRHPRSGDVAAWTKEDATPNCPECGKPMQVKTKRASGQQFWGCSQYPSCRGRRPMASRARSEFEAED